MVNHQIYFDFFIFAAYKLILLVLGLNLLINVIF
jgi:hypothetical protein